MIEVAVTKKNPNKTIRVDRFFLGNDEVEQIEIAGNNFLVAKVNKQYIYNTDVGVQEAYLRTKLAKLEDEIGDLKAENQFLKNEYKAIDEETNQLLLIVAAARHLIYYSAGKHQIVDSGQYREPLFGKLYDLVREYDLEQEKKRNK